MLKIFPALAASGALFLAPVFAAAKPIEARATLRPDAPGLPIPRQIYGQFSEHLGSGI